jgi:hypothetical protein
LREEVSTVCKGKILASPENVATDECTDEMITFRCPPLVQTAFAFTMDLAGIQLGSVVNVVDGAISRDTVRIDM